MRCVYLKYFEYDKQVLKPKKKRGSGGLMDKVSATQPRDRGFEPHTGHDHDSSFDTSTGWF